MAEETAEAKETLVVLRYRLNAVGWLGAICFVMPLALAALHVSQSYKTDFSAQLTLALRGQSQAVTYLDASGFYLVVLASVQLAGLVMVIVGRDMERVEVQQEAPVQPTSAHRRRRPQ